MAHSGTTVNGSYEQILTLTDIATGLTECAPRLVREQKLLYLVDIVDRPVKGEAAAAASTLERFLSGLRTALQGGEVRPASRRQGPGADGGVPIHSCR